MEPSTLHLISLAARHFPRDAFINILDLASFVLVAPEIIGEDRMNVFASWLKSIFANYITLATLFIAATTANIFGLSSGVTHFAFVLATGPFIAGLFWLIGRYLDNASAKRIMLVLGAIIFVCARALGIIFAFQTL